MSIKEEEAQNLDTLLDEIIRNKGKSEFDYRDILFKDESDDFIINLVTKLELCGVINTITTKEGRCLSKNNMTASFLLEANFKERYNQALVESKGKEERWNLEMQKLRSENQKLTTDLVDYAEIKNQRNVLFWVSILTIALLIVKFLSGK